MTDYFWHSVHCALLSLISVSDICAQTAGPRTKQKREINFKSFIKTRKMSFNNKIYQFVSFFLKIVVASTIKIYLRIYCTDLGTGSKDKSMTNVEKIPPSNVYE